MCEPGSLYFDVDLALGDGPEGLDELELDLLGRQLTVPDPRVALLHHLGDGRLDLTPPLGQQDDVLVQQVPLLGGVAHSDDGHQDLGRRRHVGSRTGLLLQGKQHLQSLVQLACN